MSLSTAPFRRQHLDMLLAEGISPSTSAALERRAAKLVTPRWRCGLAVGLDRVVEAAEEPVRGLSAAAPLRRREILHSRSLMEELATELREGERVNARGVAMVERLLTDGTSPLYAPGPEGALDAALRHARAALLLA
jgi:hypothetical protein